MDKWLKKVKSLRKYPKAGLFHLHLSISKEPFIKNLGGVFAGLAYMFKINTWILRTGFLLLIILGGPYRLLPVIAYFLLAIFLPKANIPAHYKRKCESRLPLRHKFYRLHKVGSFGGVLAGIAYKFKLTIKNVRTGVMGLFFIILGLDILNVLPGGFVMIGSIYSFMWIASPSKDTPADYYDVCKAEKVSWRKPTK